ncbi:DMT family transporter [Vagococcus lutrae]|uniref:DMT family transporter n=1 Tax=Vagococcus lutrae TaxID=81947 RepID=UPI0020107505|nr:DMT family transporter [Vagococcus lutrae]MDT2801070.1 DMT family transporter [Vagococcus lutrae]UQF23371.1 DMT family transporter [Vagococcus lutrae]UQF38705.1 DMT family transporter [Vagococcus lutrae]UQF64545.1 DMT family transporter [Vagococcus lutrae]
MSNKVKGTLAVLIAAMIWGGGFIATSKSLDSFPTLTMLAIRFSLSAILILLLFFKRIKLMKRQEFLKALPLGVFLFLAFATQTYGLNFTTVSNNSFLTAMNVVFTPYLGWLLYKKKPSKTIFFASVLSLIGVSLLTLNGFSFKLNIGDGITLIAAICFSLHVLWASKVSNIDHVITTFVQMSVAGVISLIGALLFDSEIKEVSLSSLYSLVYLIIVATVVSYLLQMYGTKHISPSMVSILLSTEAVFATILSVILLGEKIDIKSFISILLMSIAVFISSRDESALDTIEEPV